MEDRLAMDFISSNDFAVHHAQTQNDTRTTDREGIQRHSVVDDADMNTSPFFVCLVICASTDGDKGDFGRSTTCLVCQPKADDVCVTGNRRECLIQCVARVRTSVTIGKASCVGF